jgi:hypothetical protein
MNEAKKMVVAGLSLISRDCIQDYLALVNLP